MTEGEVIDSAQIGRKARYSWWWVVAAIAVGLFLGLGSLALINLIARPLAVIVLAAAIATALSPIVGRMAKYMPRAVAAVLVYLVLFLVVFGLFSLIVPTLIEQGRSFINSAPQYVDSIQNWLDQIAFINIDNLSTTLFDRIGSMAATLVAVPLNMLSAIFEIFVILFIALYWIILIPQMKEFFLSMFPLDEREKVGSILHRMGAAMGGYIRGSAINSVIVGALTYFGLLIIGVQYALVLGIIAAILEIIPIAGPVIAGFFIVLTALAQSPDLALIALIYVTLMQQLEGNILVPNIMRSQTETSPLLVLIAILIGSSLGGLMGALVAIPLASASRVLVKYVIAPALRKSNDAPQVVSDGDLQGDSPNTEKGSTDDK